MIEQVLGIALKTCLVIHVKLTMLSKKWIVETQQLIQQQKMLTANLCKVNFKRSDLRVLALMEEFLKILSNY